MNNSRRLGCVAFHACLLVAIACVAQEPEKKVAEAAFSFADVEYFHRFTKNDQQEYTPAGQDDLQKWDDMVTIAYYRAATDGDALARISNNVLESYKTAKAIIMKTSSVPRTKDTPAEHLIAAVFGRPGFAEIVFARFRMHEGVGTCIVYSHRLYGTALGDKTNEWLKKNGAGTEKTLMAWDAMPKESHVSK